MHWMVRLALRAALVTALLGSGQAWASGGRRQVPDVRRRPAAGVRGARRDLVVPVTLHVAAPTSRHRVMRWLARANGLLGPHGVRVEIARVVPMSGAPRTVRYTSDRRRLARLAPRDGTVHVFVVEKIGPVSRRARRQGRTVRGLHWRYRGLRRGLRGRQFVLVTRGAPSTTLAHELGHLFGLGHRAGRRNVMCSCRRGDGLGFTRAQGGLLHSGAASFLLRSRR